MYLTAYSNYALRILMYCALHPNQLVRVEDIASAYGISRPHLLKAARHLGQLGYLRTLRGRTGGVQLERQAEDIIIGEVVRQTEFCGDFVECFNPASNTCPLIGLCRLSQLFRCALDAFFQELDKVTLSDMVASGSELLVRLHAEKRIEKPIRAAQKQP